LLPNLKNVDPVMAKYVDALDPGMQYAVNYFWGTSGVGYNVDKIKAAMPDAPVDSFRMFFDPNVVKHFKDCGVTLLDAPDEVINTVFLYLGLTPNSEKPEDLAAAEKTLMASFMRPSIPPSTLRSGEWRDMPALGWSDVGQAALRARRPRTALISNTLFEGRVLFFDMLAFH
jgi:putrescine transport system substrate-binding protein